MSGQATGYLIVVIFSDDSIILLIHGFALAVFLL